MHSGRTDGWWRDPTGLALWTGFLEAGEELVAVLPGIGACDAMWLIVRRDGELAAVLLAGPDACVEVALTLLIGRPACRARVPWSLRWVADPPAGVTQPWGDPEIIRQHDCAVFKATCLGFVVFAAFVLAAWWRNEDLALLCLGLPAAMSAQAFAPWLARVAPA